MNVEYDTIDGNEDAIQRAMATGSMSKAAAEFDLDFPEDEAMFSIDLAYPDRCFTAQVSLTLPGKGEFDVETSVAFHHTDGLRLETFASDVPKAKEVADRLDELVTAAGYRAKRARHGHREHAAGAPFERRWSFHCIYR